MIMTPLTLTIFTGRLPPRTYDNADSSTCKASAGVSLFFPFAAVWVASMLPFVLRLVSQTCRPVMLLAVVTSLAPVPVPAGDFDSPAPACLARCLARRLAHPVARSPIAPRLARWHIREVWHWRDVLDCHQLRFWCAVAVPLTVSSVGLAALATAPQVGQAAAHRPRSGYSLLTRLDRHRYYHRLAQN
jgi:hypothetical protein